MVTWAIEFGKPSPHPGDNVWRPCRRVVKNRFRSFVMSVRVGLAIWSYDVADRMKVQYLGNSTRASYSFDDGNRLLKLANIRSDTTTISSFDYAYDSVGNHTRVSKVDPKRWAKPVAPSGGREEAQKLKDLLHADHRAHSLKIDLRHRVCPEAREEIGHLSILAYGLGSVDRDSSVGEKVL